MVYVIRTVVFLISLLPLSLARGLGAIIGLCAWVVKTRGAKTTAINLRACFPEKSGDEIKQLVRNSMMHWGMTLCEIPVVWRKGKKSLNWIKKIHGEELALQGKQHPGGVLLISPHYGNWEMLGYWGGSQAPITTLYQPHRRYNLDSLLVNARRKTGATLVPTNARGVAQLIKALKRGEFVGILPDMEPELNSGVFAPFFGIPALTMTLVQSLQQRTGAMVIVSFAQRVPGGFELYLTAPDQAIASDNPEESAASLNRAIEALVTISPEQYQWEYKRFKRRPEGYPKLYG